MPRQPFLPNFSHLDYVVGAKVLSDRTDLTSAIGQCIALWTYADNEMGNLFGILLGGDYEVALDVFLSLRRVANQRGALEAAAKRRLDGRDRQIFDAIMTLYSSLEQERNALAHGCFGKAENDPNVLLWIHVKDHVHFQVEVLRKLDRGDAVPDPHERLKTKMYVYRIEDLVRLYHDMEQFLEGARSFNVYLRRGANRRDLLDYIANLPIVKAEMELFQQAPDSP